MKLGHGERHGRLWYALFGGGSIKKFEAHQARCPRLGGVEVAELYICFELGNDFVLYMFYGSFILIVASIAE